MTRALAALRWLVCHPRLLLGLVVGLLLATSVRSCNRAQRANDEAARLLEAQTLLHAGQMIAEQHRAAQLAADAAAAARENGDLRKALEEARRAAPGAKPSTVVRLRTGPSAVTGTPTPGAAPLQVSPTSNAPPAGGAHGGEPAPCLLRPGDVAEIRVDEVTLETRQGNHLLVAAASAWRLEPAPPVRLFGGKLSADVFVEKAPETHGRGRWGAGAWVGLSRDGWSAGPALSPPALRLWRWEVEAVVGGGVGPAGVWQMGAVGLVRF